MDDLGLSVFYRTYSRKNNGIRETYQNVIDRVIKGLSNWLLPQDLKLIYKQLENQTAFPSGRFLWTGGTDWLSKPDNFPGAYNCTSLNIVDWESFALLMDLSMMGCGTGAQLDEIYKLPTILNKLTIEIESTPVKTNRQETTTYWHDWQNKNNLQIVVGDSREGWVKSVLLLLQESSKQIETNEINIKIDLTNIRPKGSQLKGFGGVANPVKVFGMYQRLADILNGAIGRKLNSVECCLILGVLGDVVVSGNIRRSAGIRQRSSNDKDFAVCKDNLWKQNELGQWVIDADKDCLRMANHTRLYYQKPTLKECVDAVSKQFYSGEGAIQWIGESIARANADIITNENKKKGFIDALQTSEAEAKAYLKSLTTKTLTYWANRFDKLTTESETTEETETDINHRFSRFALNPCAEIIGKDFLCNLSEVHLNNLNPWDITEQIKAFRAASLSVAALLHHQFKEPRYAYSRSVDPIVGVSFTGLFDFFVNAFGVKWLEWWAAGRVKNWGLNDKLIPELWGKLNPNHSEFKRPKYLSEVFAEAEIGFLIYWRQIVHKTVANYCQENNLKCPNRCTTVQPAGTKSLLTGASPGWHPPKSQRFIRRVTFAKNDPIALACLELGYSVVPSQSDKDENGALLDNPFDLRCTEWLVEFPVAVNWANLPGADKIDVSKFSALAQFDFYMTVQKHYSRHNTSGTIELRENEIQMFAEAIYNAIKNDEGYISVALLSRFDNYQSFPRLPFEPIDKETYNRLIKEKNGRAKTLDFKEAIDAFDKGSNFISLENGPAGCDSARCLIS